MASEAKVEELEEEEEEEEKGNSLPSSMVSTAMCLYLAAVSVGVSLFADDASSEREGVGEGEKAELRGVEALEGVCALDAEKRLALPPVRLRR